MLADKQFFIDSLNKLNNDELKDKCISLYTEYNELRLKHSANEKINTETFLLYQQVLAERDKLLSENLNLKAALEKEIDKNSLRAKSTFGRKTESMLSLINSAQNKADEIEDEAQYEDNDADVYTTSRSNVVSFSGHKSDKADKKDKTSKTTKKNNPLAESMKDLPREIFYDINVEELDKKYGKGNWRITFWHEHTTLEKLDTPYYKKTVYTPCISVGVEHNLYTEPYENMLLDRSVASASIVSDILYRKFLLSLPFNRQSMDYNMQGIKLSKQTIINWISRIVPQYMEPVVEYYIECLVKYKYTQNDETYITVNKDERGPGHKSFIWVHSSSEYLDCNPIIVFCYEATRNTDHLRSIFKDFIGYITCDAYISYQVLESESNGNITVSGCFMHARRYFAEAFFVNDIASLTDEQLRELPETKALLLIRDIYAEENKLKNMSATKRLAIRQEKVSPLVDHFFTYVHELEKSKEVFSDRMNKAITYAVNQEQHLRVFLTDGNICCDNGNAERHIRAYSVGRANWLFADTVAGAEINATMYSITETAKANNANVLIYLRYLLEEMPYHKNDTDRSYLADMVPWSDKYKTYEQEYISQNRHMCQNLFVEPEKPKTPRVNQTTEVTVKFKSA